jgi:serine/threonine-protein phosphatase 2A activator
MYNAEVLSKFPVVQHFPFGSLFPWMHNPDAPIPMATTHTNSQPSSQPSFHGARDTKPPSSVPTMTTRPAGIGGEVGGTKAPWLSGPTHRSIPGASLPGPTTSWTGQSGVPGMPATKAPWASAGASRETGMPTRFPPSNVGRGPSSNIPSTTMPTRFPGPGVGTAAPWAKPTPKKEPEFKEQDEEKSTAP